jgi:hypothetical protein
MPAGIVLYGGPPLADKVIELAVELEAHARRLLIAYLPAGSKMQVLMKADHNVQLRVRSCPSGRIRTS